VADPVQVHDGDVLLIGRRGVFFAVARRVSPRRISIEPIDPRRRDRSVKPDEIVTVYRAVGPPLSPPRRLRPAPRQLRSDDRSSPTPAG
jgi:hypothetical protein